MRGSDSSSAGLSRRGFLAGIGLAGAAGLTTVSPTTRARAAEPRSRTPLPSDRQGFNRRWYAPRLEAVYTPTTAAEVEACVQEALSTYGRDVKVVSGRHCYEAFVYHDDTRAIIDMSGVCDAGYDVEREAYFVDAGAENWTAYRSLLNGSGVTLPAGSCYSVGAGGHITAGGYGLLSRLHGLTIDHVTGIELVTWDAAAGRATLREVSATSSDPHERDLFWAVRGAGGGNFGVVTRFWFARLPDAPAWATLWTPTWDWDLLDERSFARLLARYADFVAEIGHRQFSLLRLRHTSAGAINMTLQVPSGPRNSREEHIARARWTIRRARAALGIAPTSQTTLHYTYLEAVQTLNGSGPNQFGKYKSAYMRKPFPDDQVSALYAGLRRVPRGLDAADMAASLVQVNSYGGAVNSVAPDATPVPQRSSIMKLQYQTYWNNDSIPGLASSGDAGRQQEAHLQWIDRIYSEAYAAYGGTPDPRRDPSGTVDGCYYGYPDIGLGTRADGRLDDALSLYFGANFRDNTRNLVSVKDHWDPQEYFHHAQSIPAR